jgi:deazaflavin-dependent oxidoreductase (nitroreductase family)
MVEVSSTGQRRGENMSDEGSSGEAAANMNDWNAQIITEFRANNGIVGGPFEGAPVLLLHTNGAKSGNLRVNPMMYLNLEEKVYVFASKAGADTNPDWYHNLAANPAVTVEIGDKTVEAVARVLTTDERNAIYTVQAERFPQFAEYENKTSRVIPVIELSW